MLLAALEGKDNLRYWLKFGGREALAYYGAGEDVQRIPSEHIEFIKECRDYYETVNHIFVHAYYDPDLPLHQQRWDGLRWASLPREPKRHCSGKVAIVGHTAQESGEILDLGCVKCIDAFCHGGGWLTALDVGMGHVWQANEAGKVRGREPRNFGAKLQKGLGEDGRITPFVTPFRSILAPFRRFRRQRRQQGRSLQNFNLQ